ncbi:hypothetical protein SVAN01_01972 [Stagonosporopsis vannaccii]|nr:hypothetical protein SVAN01_01972 [Stagonosporopsis vannaccii]
MRTATIISSSLLAIAVSGAPIDLPKLPVSLPSLGLSDPTGFPATLPSGLPAGVPANDVELPVEHPAVKRTELPVANGVVENVKLPNLITLPTLPKVPVGNVNLPFRRADVPLVGDVLKDITIIDGTDPAVHSPLPVINPPIETGLIKNAVDTSINAPITVAVDDLVEIPAIDVPVVAVPAVPGVGVPAIPAGPLAGLASRDIKQSLPVVGGANIPLDAGNIQVGTADTYLDDLLKGTKIESFPKIAREIEQSLPVVGGANVPLDVGKIEVGTVDKDVNEVVDGTTIKDVPVLNVVKGTTIKDLPNLGRREIKQSLPVVGGVNVPLDAGKVQVSNVDKYLADVVKGTTTGL